MGPWRSHALRKGRVVRAKLTRLRRTSLTACILGNGLMEKAVAARVIAWRSIRELRDVPFPHRGGEHPASHGADPLDRVVHVEVPQPDRGIVDADCEGPPVRAKGHRADFLCWACQPLAKLTGVGRVGGVP